MWAKQKQLPHFPGKSQTNCENGEPLTDKTHMTRFGPKGGGPWRANFKNRFASLGTADFASAGASRGGAEDLVGSLPERRGVPPSVPQSSPTFGQPSTAALPFGGAQDRNRSRKIWMLVFLLASLQKPAKRGCEIHVENHIR